MKAKYLTILLAASFSFASCGESSKSWSSEEKSNFIENCKSAMPNQTEQAKTEYCNCSLGVAMSEWSTGAEADKAFEELTMAELMELVAPCVEFIME